MTATNITEENLKPCPFCGGKAQIMYGPDHEHSLYGAWARCKKCGARVPEKCLPMNYYAVIQRVVSTVRRRWNRRAGEGGVE